MDQLMQFEEQKQSTMPQGYHVSSLPFLPNALVSPSTYQDQISSQMTGPPVQYPVNLGMANFTNFRSKRDFIFDQLNQLNIPTRPLQ